MGVYYGDLLVEGVVLCEIKAAKSLEPEHIAQTLNYLKACESMAYSGAGR
jgi:GxxExxY protein